MEELQEADLHHGHEGIAIAVAHADAVDPVPLHHAIEVESQWRTPSEFQQPTWHESGLASDAVTVSAAQHEVPDEARLHPDIADAIGEHLVHGNPCPCGLAVAPDPGGDLRVDQRCGLTAEHGIIIVGQRHLPDRELHLAYAGEKPHGEVEVPAHLHVIGISEQEAGVAIIPRLIRFDEDSNTVLVRLEWLALGTDHAMQADPAGGRRTIVPHPLLPVS